MKRRQHFPFDEIKATQAACQFMLLEGRTMNIMKLVKLVYALDRLSIQRRGIPVVGGAYFSLPNGPITSELLDLINSGKLSARSIWESLISDRIDHEVGLRTQNEPPADELAPSEIQLIKEIYEEHGNKDQWELRDWSHKHCEEWGPLDSGRDLIPLDKMGRALGFSDEEIAQLQQDAEEQRFIGAALCA